MRMFSSEPGWECFRVNLNEIAFEWTWMRMISSEPRWECFRVNLDENVFEIEIKVLQWNVQFEKLAYMQSKKNLFGNDLLWNDSPYSKGFMKFGCLEPFKIMVVFWNFLMVERRLYFFSRRSKIIFWGKNRITLFQTHKWENSSFFSTLVYVHLHG